MFQCCLTCPWSSGNVSVPCVLLSLPQKGLCMLLMFLLICSSGMPQLQWLFAPQADAVERNQVTNGQMWVLLLGQVLFLLWLVVLNKVQVNCTLASLLLAVAELIPCADSPFSLSL